MLKTIEDAFGLLFTGFILAVILIPFLPLIFKACLHWQGKAA